MVNKVKFANLYPEQRDEFYYVLQGRLSDKEWCEINYINPYSREGIIQARKEIYKEMFEK